MKNFIHILLYRYRPASILAIVIVLVLVITQIPINLPYYITVPGKTLASAEWMIAINSSGRVITTKINRLQGLTNMYTTHQFGRQDIANFVLRESLHQGSMIHSGDTIGVLQSTELLLNIQKLKGEIENNKAMLLQAKTGEKSSVVDEVNKAIEYAMAVKEQSQKEFLRAKQLVVKNIISQQEFEIIEQKLRTSEIAVDMQKARLKTVTTGLKNEEVEVINSRISALLKELDEMNRLSAKYAFISPISGILLQYGNADTLVSVVDVSKYTVTMPIPIAENDFVFAGQKFQLTPFNQHEIPIATIIRKDRTVTNLRGSQVFFATGTFSHPKENLHGLMTECKIYCGTITLSEFIKRKMQSTLQ